MPKAGAPDADKARQAIVELLLGAGEPLTTREVAAANARKGVECPDSTVRFLTMLRTKGVIKGEVSVKKGGWVWWVEGADRMEGGREQD
jgi:hypothetical protein